jgi:DNA-binding NtrC family response regulator
LARILVIDDEESIRNLYRTVLEREGYEVHTAENGVAGLRVVQEHAFDLFITDIFMPEKSGIETIEELLEISPELKIIAVSGGGIERERVSHLILAQRYGAVSALVKPVPLKDLRSEVRRLLASTLDA